MMMMITACKSLKSYMHEVILYESICVYVSMCGGSFLPLLVRMYGCVGWTTMHRM